MGYEVALLFCPRHAALGVAGAEGLPGTYIEFEGHRYYYCEMTARGWQIGELPPDHTGDRFEVAPIRSLAPRVVLPEDL